MNQRPKILTLGWEFPPLYTGGLGPACYGLSKALSQHADLTIVLPRLAPSFSMKNIRFIGLNRKTATRSQWKNKKQASFSSVETVPSELQSSYPIHNQYSFKEPDNSFFTREESFQLFNEENIYGPSIMEKVAAYRQNVCSIAAHKSFDIIHAHDWITYPAAVQLKKITGKPLVVHVHSLETDRVHALSRNKVYEIEKKGMEAADYILPVSEYTKSNIIQHYRIKAEKIVAVYNGYDQEFQTANTRAKKYSATPTSKNVLFLGRITAQKGPEYLVETAKKLLAKKSDVTFYIAGTGDMQTHLEWLVQKEKLESKIIFTGFLNKAGVKKMLSMTDAYIMPSVSEPFGLSALEAAQYNIPCVLSKQSGAAEVMPHTLQSDYWDTDKMADYLYALLHYSGLSETLTEKTSAHLPDINWENSAKKVLDVYSSLLSRN